MKVAELKATDMVAKYEKVDVERKTVEKDATESTQKVEVREKNIEEAVEKINKQLEATNTKIKFKIHESEHSLNNKVSIKVVDEESEKVIAEIPSEEAIEMAEKMQQVIGILFDASK